MSKCLLWKGPIGTSFLWKSAPLTLFLWQFLMNHFHLILPTCLIKAKLRKSLSLHNEGSFSQIFVLVTLYSKWINYQHTSNPNDLKPQFIMWLNLQVYLYLDMKQIKALYRLIWKGHSSELAMSAFIYFFALCMWKYFTPKLIAVF